MVASFLFFAGQLVKGAGEGGGIVGGGKEPVA